MFVNITSDGAPWHKINSTLGVARLICQDGIPEQLPQEIVVTLMSRCDRFGKLLPPKALKSGDSVSVISGALTNFIATVESIDSNRRIWVLIDLMGRPTRVQVTSEKLKLSN